MSTIPTSTQTRPRLTREDVLDGRDVAELLHLPIYIRANRRRLELTQEALAERCDMHPVEVGRAERGARDLRISTVVKLARGLGIPAGELFRGL
jgi:ribosome-binding protein aMBF1 (putative translation factor)